MTWPHSGHKLNESRCAAMQSRLKSKFRVHDSDEGNDRCLCVWKGNCAGCVCTRSNGRNWRRSWRGAEVCRRGGTLPQASPSASSECCGWGRRRPRRTPPANSQPITCQTHQ
jgi:hypothetical protein